MDSICLKKHGVHVTYCHRIVKCLLVSQRFLNRSAVIFQYLSGRSLVKKEDLLK